MFYHLDDGILRLLEQAPAEESRWQGECFVFDERVAVTHGLDLGSYSPCRACRMPLSQADHASDRFEEGLARFRCLEARMDEQRANYAERHRQALIAEKRGQAHIGEVMGDKGGNAS